MRGYGFGAASAGAEAAGEVGEARGVCVQLGGLGGGRSDGGEFGRHECCRGEDPTQFLDEVLGPALGPEHGVLRVEGALAALGVV